MRLIVTRPEPHASEWVAALRARGVDALALPLTEIAFEPMQGSLAAARAGIADWQAIMFVSGAAVRAFLRAGTAARLQESEIGAARAWAPGPGTAQALVGTGWPQGSIDSPADTAPQSDSEALWAVTAAQVGPGTRVLIVRGGDADGLPVGRRWLADRIRAAGGRVGEVVAYRTCEPRLGAAQQALLGRAGVEDALWLFSSAQALAHLLRMAPQRDWSRTRAVVTHARIGAAAQRAGFEIAAVTHPRLADVIAAIEALA